MIFVVLSHMHTFCLLKKIKKKRVKWELNPYNKEYNEVWETNRLHSNGCRGIINWNNDGHQHWQGVDGGGMKETKEKSYNND